MEDLTKDEFILAIYNNLFDTLQTNSAESLNEIVNPTTMIKILKEIDDYIEEVTDTK